MSIGDRIARTTSSTPSANNSIDQSGRLAGRQWQIYHIVKERRAPGMGYMPNAPTGRLLVSVGGTLRADGHVGYCLTVTPSCTRHLINVMTCLEGRLIQLIYARHIQIT